ncbi:MAG: ABC transporter ATP-binding protein [Oligoflexia bacterium]|nr:ABC transporter ATP-binding protein [Oligoflexia bacterium]
MDHRFSSLLLYLKKLYLLVGKKVFTIYILGLVSGCLYFLTDLAIAFNFQVFLSFLGLADPSIVKVPDWVPQKSLNFAVAFLLVIGFLRAILQWIQTFMQGAAVESFKHQIRSRLLKWTFGLDVPSTQDTILFFNERTNSASIAVSGLHTMAMKATTSLLLGLELFWLAPKTSLYVVVFIGIASLPMRMIDKKISKLGGGIKTEWDHINSRLLVSLKNYLLLRIYGLVKNEEQSINDSLGKYLARILSVFNFNGLKFSTTQYMGLVLVCLVSLLKGPNNEMASGVIASYLFLLLRFLQSLSDVAASTTTINMYWGQMQDFAELCYKKFEVNQDTNGQRQLSRISNPVGWRVQNVSFSYPGVEGQPLFHNFDLNIPAANTLVIHGPSGSGKSTLLNILLGILKPQRGKIIATLGNNEFEVNQIMAELLEAVGYVGAESFIIEGTIRENLLYGVNRKTTEDEIIRALQMAECDFVFGFPDGLNHMLSEHGTGLSAGQAQRLSLVRALLREPKILVLDEATANLDYETELRLVKTLEAIKTNMTILAVTHRPALLRLADIQLRFPLNSNPL